MADVIELAQSTETLLIFGLIAIGLYYFATADSLQGVRDVLSGIANPDFGGVTDLPAGTVLAPGQGANTTTGVLGNTASGTHFSYSAGGTLAVMNPSGGPPYNFGQSAVIPGSSGQTLAQLIAGGAAPGDVADMVIAAEYAAGYPSQ